MQTAREVATDQQVSDNGYLPELQSNGSRFRLVANPVQFDERSPTLRPAPELAQHTEDVLHELEIGWDEIAAYKDSGALG